ncbi:MAG TPA: glycosyltransferase family 4 protein [Pyrinomonadaceae bacterium]|nr:glycosyltransferase family 4 protein [Pyrinomonadaceae bacterium]
MSRIAILSRDITPADAVSNDVLAMQGLLSKRDHEVRVFAYSTSLTVPEIFPSNGALSYLDGPEDVLIYHHSIGWDAGVEIVKTASCRKIIKYHNITPPEFFEGISEQHVGLCRSGRLQVKDIIECRPDLLLAASFFNMADLIAAGSQNDKTFVLPPFNQADKLQAGAANFDILDNYSDGSVNLLTVGGVRPNKGHAALVEAFAIYYYQFNRAARLFVVGVETDALAPYAMILRQLINSWDIDSRIVFTGEISNESLKAYYMLADALVTTSEHEGFCVPLAEAMAMKVPIVAYASTAIPETADDAGLVWNERDPYLLAQSIDCLLANEPAKMALVARGAERYENAFSNKAIEKEFLEVTARAGFEF